MAVTVQEASNFHHAGRGIITRTVQAVDDLRAYARTFEIRGGKLAMDQGEADAPADSIGSMTEEMIGFHNVLIAFLDANNGQWQDVLDKYRTDY